MPTPTYGLRYPDGADIPNGPLQLQNLAEDVEDTLGDGLTAWLSYTPAWTGSTGNPGVGNATRTGRYCKLGRIVHFTAKILIGSTTTVGSGFYSISLPPGLPVSTVGTCLCMAYYFDTSGAGESDKHYIGIGNISATAQEVDRIRFVGDTLNGLPWSATAPVVPATDDYVIVTGTYETSVA